MSCEDARYYNNGEVTPSDSLDVTNCQADGVPDAESAELAAVNAEISALKTEVEKTITPDLADDLEGYGWGV